MTPAPSLTSLFATSLKLALISAFPPHHYLECILCSHQHRTQCGLVSCIIAPLRGPILHHCFAALSEYDASISHTLRAAALYYCYPSTKTSSSLLSPPSYLLSVDSLSHPVLSHCSLLLHLPWRRFHHHPHPSCSLHCLPLLAGYVFSFTLRFISSHRAVPHVSTQCIMRLPLALPATGIHSHHSPPSCSLRPRS